MAAKVLIAYSSKHRSTAEIAEAVGKAIIGAGLGAVVQPAGEVRSLDGYDAVILGSVVQIGRWQREATDFVKRFEHELRRRPAWLFSSGPTGGSPKAGAEVAKALASPEGFPVPKEVERFIARIGAQGHATFPGKVGKDVGGIFAKWVPTGDWRDFDAISAWARGIATNLARTPVATG